VTAQVLLDASFWIALRDRREPEPLRLFRAGLQMPAGVPVATVAIGGARNAGVLAVQILAVAYAALQKKVLAFKARLAQESRAKNRKLVR